MSRWVGSYWDEEDITYVWEIGDDGGALVPSS
jgi:hypothetical protein